MCDSGVEGWPVIIPRQVQLDRHLIEHENFIEANLDVVIKFRNSHEFVPESCDVEA